MSQSNPSAPIDAVPADAASADAVPAPAPAEVPFDRARQVGNITLFVDERKEWNTEEDPSFPAAPPDDKTLSPHQIRTLQLLANGVSITNAALDTGVSRNTIHRWLRCHPTMRAMHNRWKQVCHDSAESRLIALQDTAVEVLAEELENKRNPRVAAMLLKYLGAMAPPQITATTPAAAQREIDLERRERNLQLGKRTGEVRHDEEYMDRRDKLVDDKPAGN